MRPENALLGAPDIEAALGEPRRERLVGDVLLREARCHEARDAVVDGAELLGRRVDGDALEPDAVAPGPAVHRRER